MIMVQNSPKNGLKWVLFDVFFACVLMCVHSIGLDLLIKWCPFHESCNLAVIYDVLMGLSYSF
jgi:hypothetical protein